MPMRRCDDATMQRCNDATMQRCDDATIRWYDDDAKTRHSRRHNKTRRYDNVTTLLSMPMCTYIIVQFTDLFEVLAGAQTIWIERCVLWFRPVSSASAPAPMKIIRMNFGFAGFLWCHACAIFMPFNSFLVPSCKKLTVDSWQLTALRRRALCYDALFSIPNASPLRIPVLLLSITLLEYSISTTFVPLSAVLAILARGFAWSYSLFIGRGQTEEKRRKKRVGWVISLHLQSAPTMGGVLVEAWWPTRL